jgi:hypothetical protein
MMTGAKVGTRGLTLAALTAAVSVLAACEGGLDMAGAEAAIQTGLAEQLEMPIAFVSCPEERELKSGDVFECTATAETGGDLTIQVTQVDDAGNIEWELTNGDEVLLLSLLEESIVAGLADQLDVEATVDCGGKMRVSVPGQTFECMATAGTSSSAVVVTINDKEGNVSWALK